MSAPEYRRSVVLLRGLNVGGKNTLPMAVLRDICTTLGCRNVTTYIQSGNVILDRDLPPDIINAGIASAIQQAVGFTPRMVSRRAAELADIVAMNPYPDTEERFVHIGFMSDVPTSAAIASLGQPDCAPERFRIVSRHIYLDYREGIGASKRLAKIPFERKLGVSITARNMRTVRKLAALAAHK